MKKKNNTEPAQIVCPVCSFDNPESWAVLNKPSGGYFHCVNCHYIWRNPQERLTLALEKERYETHQNGNEGHRLFLKPLLDHVQDHEPVGAQGLDWGSGPVPVLAEMLESLGFKMSTYDLHFQSQFPKGEFDFITCTEVIEHFHDPMTEVSKMRQSLRPGGRLYLMTEMHPHFDFQSFANWPYRRDPTHVSFLSSTSLEILCARAGFQRPSSDSKADLNSKGLRWIFTRLKTSLASS